MVRKCHHLIALLCLIDRLHAAAFQPVKSHSGRNCQSASASPFRLHQSRPKNTVVETLDQSKRKNKKQETRGNRRVQKILQSLSVLEGNRESDIKSPLAGLEWARAKRYLYHRNDLTPEQVQKVLQFLDHVLLGDKVVACTVIQNNPRILRKSVANFLEPTAHFLRNLYGEDLFCEAVRRNPGLLLSRGVGYNAVEHVTTANENLLLNRLRLKRQAVAQLKTKAPWLFQRPTDKLLSVVDYWDNLLQSSSKDPIVLTQDERQSMIGKLLKAYPTIFNLSVDHGLAPKVEFLQEKCSLTLKDVCSLMAGSKAALFCLSIEDNLNPTLDLLMDCLSHIKDVEKRRQIIRKCIVSHPQIMCLSQSNLQEKMFYFSKIESTCGGKDKYVAARILSRSPAAFSLSLKENIVPKVSFLADVWGRPAPKVEWVDGQISIQDTKTHWASKGQHESKNSLGDLLAEYPSILTMSLEGNLQPTLHFYNRTGFIKLSSDWRMQSTSSVPVIRARYIASSLFQRLLPRWHFYLLRKEKLANVLNGNQLEQPSLHLLAVSSDKIFCDYLGVQIHDYAAFKEDAIPRLKFSSQFDTWLKTGRPIDV